MFWRNVVLVKDIIKGIKRRIRLEVDKIFRRRRYYSQLGEDEYIYKNLFSKPNLRGGCFVEVGALDGVTFSNTKFFEDYLGWRGMLIEPLPEQFEKLKNNRPKNILINAAISLTEMKVDFIGDWATAGMVHTMAESFQKKWNPDGKLYAVNGIPFCQLLAQHKIKFIDFLSIDVEGAELEVLKTFDWNIPVGVVAIELDGYSLNKDDLCRDILIKHGFLLLKRLRISEIWYHPLNIIESRRRAKIVF